MIRIATDFLKNALYVSFKKMQIKTEKNKDSWFNFIFKKDLVFPFLKYIIEGCLQMKKHTKMFSILMIAISANTYKCTDFTVC